MMSSYLDTQLNRLRQHLQRDDTLQALDEILGLSASVPDVYNEVILQKARYIRVERDARKGLITRETADVEKNRINQAIISLLNELPAKLTPENVPVSPPPVSATSAPPTALEEAVYLPAKSAQTILGINNLRQIAWVERGVASAKSVCRVLTPKGVGTGFLVGSDLLMTNNHVIPSAEIAGETVIEFNYELRFDGSFGVTQRHRLDPASYCTNSVLDYTLVRVMPGANNAPPETWGRLTLNPQADPVPGEHVCIIQHPNGGLKQIVMTENRVVKLQGPYLLYTTDTMPGSSGSPVFNDAWQVIAIHHAGNGLNEGVLMSHIVPDAQKAGFWPTT